MTLPDRLQRALQRMDASLDTLEAALTRRAEHDAARSDHETEFSLMQDDRSRLAVELDAALARVRTLDRAADEVSGRLDRAGTTVRAILDELATIGHDADPAEPA